MKKETKLARAVQRCAKIYKLHPDGLERLLALADQHPSWTIRKLYEKLLEPRIRTCVVVSLPLSLEEKLTKISKKLKVSPEYVVYWALKEYIERRS